LSGHITSLEIDRFCTINPFDVEQLPDNTNGEGGGNGSIRNTGGKEKMVVVMKYAEREHTKTRKYKDMSRPETIHNFIITEVVWCDVFYSKSVWIFDIPN
jgi:hypothetical protein